MDANEAAVEAGRAARKVVPRGRLAEWDPAGRPRTALDVLFAQHAERDADLLPIRYGRMSASPWTYLRGAAAVMAADLALYPNSGLTAQLCGDAHVLNYGLWASPERNLIFDLRDFDETLPGPFEWDVKRLATSLVVCAHENGMPAAAADAAVDAAVTNYCEHMRRYASMSEMDVWYYRIDADAAMSALNKRDRKAMAKNIEKQATRRTSAGAFEKLTELRDGKRRIIESAPYRVRLDTRTDEAEIELVRSVFDTYAASVPAHLNRLFDRFELTDVARQVVGVGSVGMRVYLVLVEGHSGQAPMFLQVKQAGASVYESYVEPSKYDNHGKRVVVGQRLMQSATDLFTGWTRIRDLDFYVRQFRDMKIIPDSQRVAPILTPFAAVCGQALAKAHARSGDPVAIDAYLGNGSLFTAAVSQFARAYAEQTREDHADLATAVKNGDVETVAGW